jgi:hypothetical protein
MTVAAEEDQVTWLVTSEILPSLKCSAAVNCCDPGNETAPPEGEMLRNCGVTTVSVELLSNPL